MDDSERLLADLRKRSTTIAPLRLRRTTINKPITVESLCDWETDKVELLRLELKQWQTSNWPSQFLNVNVSFLAATTRSLYLEDRSSPSNPTLTPRTGTSSVVMVQHSRSQESVSRFLHLIQQPLTKWTCMCLSLQCSAAKCTAIERNCENTFN